MRTPAAAHVHACRHHDVSCQKPGVALQLLHMLGIEEATTWLGVIGAKLCITQASLCKCWTCSAVAEASQTLSMAQRDGCQRTGIAWGNGLWYYNDKGLLLMPFNVQGCLPKETDEQLLQTLNVPLSCKQFPSALNMRILEAIALTVHQKNLLSHSAVNACSGGSSSSTNLHRSLIEDNNLAQ